MIKQIEPSDIAKAAALVRESYATVANDFGFTEQNFPKFVGFVTTAERLQNHADWGWWMYGLYDNERLVGYASISKIANAKNEYELHNLAVLPDYRYKGCGKQLLDFCKAKVNELGGEKIKIGIIEENKVLKNWYSANGFIHTGTKKFDHMPITVGFMEWAPGGSTGCAAMK